MTPEEQAAADAKASADKAAADAAAAEAANKNKPDDEKFSREYVERLRNEAKAAKDRAKALEDAAAQREADEAKAKDDQKKVAELAEKRAKEAEKKLADATANTNQRLIRAELRSLAREAGILDIDDIKLLDVKDVTVDDDGEVIGAKAAIDAFKAAKPHKFKTAADTSANEGDKGDKGGKTEGAKITPGTNNRAQGKPTDFSDKTVTDEAFEDAWSKA
jgi:hypothetical protein